MLGKILIPTLILGGVTCVVISAAVKKRHQAEYVEVTISDLKKLASMQDKYFIVHNRYAVFSDLKALGFTPSENVQVAIGIDARNDIWMAEARHVLSDQKCSAAGLIQPFGPVREHQVRQAAVIRCEKINH